MDKSKNKETKTINNFEKLLLDTLKTDSELDNLSDTEMKKLNEKCKSDTSDQIEPDDILQILANLSEMTDKIKECRNTIKFKSY